MLLDPLPWTWRASQDLGPGAELAGLFARDLRAGSVGCVLFKWRRRVSCFARIALSGGRDGPIGLARASQQGG